MILDINSLNQLKQKDRQAIAETGLSNFGIDKIINQYSQIYSAMRIVYESINCLQW